MTVLCASFTCPTTSGLIWRKYGNAFIFFFNDTATTEIYTLSLHDALPISRATRTRAARRAPRRPPRRSPPAPGGRRDRKSTRLNSSHSQISYAVFCLKKKKESSFFLTTAQDSLSTSF